MNLGLSDVFRREPRFIGVVTPSGNTVVERVTMAILRMFPDVTPLFSRTPVFGSADPFPDRYDLDGMLGAARLLAHAKPELLLWNGSKGAKIGVAHDVDFAAQVRTETGIACTTSIIALYAALQQRGVRRVAVVSPYADDYQRGLVAAIEAAGYEVVAERHSALDDNLDFASIPSARIASMVREAAASKPDAVLTLCTNFPAAPLAATLEAETGVPVFDSVSLGVWGALRKLGIDTSPAAAWGRVFAEGAGA